MRNATLLLLLVALLAGACSRHPTYGRPTPRDTVPNTKVPGSPEPKMDAPAR